MPRGRKRKVTKSATKPSVAKSYLQETFSQLPAVSDDLKNGHVLYKYITTANRSRAKTEIFLKQNLPDVDRYTFGNSLNLTIKTLVKHSLDKYRKLNDPREFQKFSSLCSEGFHFQVKPTLSPFPDTSTMKCTDPNSKALILSPNSPIPDSASTSTAIVEGATTLPLRNPRENLTPRTEKLKKRLKFMSKSNAEMKKRYLKHITSLRSEINEQKRIKIKRLNQHINRKNKAIGAKNALIRELRKKLKEAITPLNDAELNKLKKNHDRLKNSNKLKHANAASTFVSIEQFNDLKMMLIEKDCTIKKLEDEKLKLEEMISELKQQNSETGTKKDGKTFSVDTRMKVFNFLLNQVPTENIPKLIMKMDTVNNIPNRTTVETMALELGIIADLQSSELAMKTKDMTLCFDATTQEGTHINSIDFTTRKETNVFAVDELPGGTAEDYYHHVCDSLDHLASVYADFHDEEFQHCRNNIISNISNTMTDRAAVNHSAIQKLELTWGKTLNKLNCNLHPLETITTCCKAALKHLETSKGNLFGRDCIAGNLVLQISKFRYKDGKGDPKGFTAFLHKHGLPKGLIPRYRGNRLHVFFHICGKLHEHYAIFNEFFTTGTVSCGGLQSSLKKDFKNNEAVLQMQVSGIMGKMLSGPWLTKFYSNVDLQINHVNTIQIIQDVIKELKLCSNHPISILSRTHDFFGNKLSTDDSTLEKLRILPSNQNQHIFSQMVVVCIGSIISVLQRQYKTYFEANLDEKSKEEMLSARPHNIDAERMMGLFSAEKKRSKNATVSYISSRMRAKQNKVIQYLEGFDTSMRKRRVEWAMKMAIKTKFRNRKKLDDIRKEISLRLAAKVQKKQEQSRKNLEKKLKTIDIRDIRAEFPNLEEAYVANISDILSGQVVGRDVYHVWYDEITQKKTVYFGRIEKLKRIQGRAHCYKIAYWEEKETYADATDYDIEQYAVCADFMEGGLIFR